MSLASRSSEPIYKALLYWEQAVCVPLPNRSQRLLPCSNLRPYTIESICDFECLLSGACWSGSQLVYMSVCQATYYHLYYTDQLSSLHNAIRGHCRLVAIGSPKSAQSSQSSQSTKLTKSTQSTQPTETTQGDSMFTSHIKKKAPPPGGHVFEATSIILKLVQDIIGINLLTKFHEDQTINVAFREKCPSPRLKYIIKTNLLNKFHEDWTINVASRVLTRQMTNGPTDQQTDRAKTICPPLL
ncbi:hypothetical protein DPMN_124042 [Dreissena polymorpha]|uniref:Uncharacterized protein n=1 Tax=Dreissena polymorpha TaxID=45954 RepID=A0A9D4GUX8_DREPO|nr:hypothetical protein DPMN_124042 [Dreissena polymorpha]